MGSQFPLALIPSALFLFTAGFLFLDGFPSRLIEVHEGYVSIGRRIIPWMDIRRVDRTCWISPLVVRITLFDDSRLLLIYPGDLDSCNSLLRNLRRHSRDALIDGIPYRQYWGELLAPGRAQDRGHAAAIPHPAPGGRGRGRAPLPAAQDGRKPRPEELHGREVVRGSSPLRALETGSPGCSAVFALVAALGARALASLAGLPADPR